MLKKGLKYDIINKHQYTIDSNDSKEFNNVTEVIKKMKFFEPVSMDTGFYFMSILGVRKRIYESSCIKSKASNRF